LFGVEGRPVVGAAGAGLWLKRWQRGVFAVAATDFLGFWSFQFAFRGETELCKLARLKLAHFARFLIEDERAVAHAANLLDEMADGYKHFAEFAVAAFDEDNFEPWIVTLANLANAGRRRADHGRTGFSALDVDAATQEVELVFCGLACNFDEVGFFDA
jgi:hypothetical protein